MQQVEIRQGAEEFTLGAGPTGVLLVHGFTGSPYSMRGLGEYLADRGLSVRGLRLPGHGTSWEDCNTKTARDWVEAVDEEFERFAAAHDEVFLVGLSFGGTLALNLATRNPDRVAGVVTLAGFVMSKDPLRFAAPIMARVIKSFPGLGNDICQPDQDELCYDRIPVRAVPHVLKLMSQTRGLLPSLRIPLLAMHSRNDHTVPPESSQAIYDEAGSIAKEIVWFERSYHVITMDYDRDEVFERTYDFIKERAQRAV